MLIKIIENFRISQAIYLEKICIIYVVINFQKFEKTLKYYFLYFLNIFWSIFIINSRNYRRQ